MSGNKKILLEIEHSLGGRIASMLLNCIGIIFCLFFFFSIENYFVTSLLCIIIFIFFYNIINTLIFKKLVFTDKQIVKQFFNPLKFCIMEISLKYTEMDVEFWNRIWNTKLTFWKKDQKLKTKWKYSFDLTGINDRYIESIKQILIDKQVIKGDEYEWYY